MTTDTLHGKIDEGTGKLKQAVGEATGNDDLANRGTVQQVKGHAEQAWGSVKDAAARTHEQHETDHKTEHVQHAHDVRETVANAAKNVKEHIQNAVNPDHTR